MSPWLLVVRYWLLLWLWLAVSILSWAHCVQRLLCCYAFMVYFYVFGMCMPAILLQPTGARALQPQRQSQSARTRSYTYV